MGTNYYLSRDVCEHCGRGGTDIHIGKSSFGWCFSLHVASGSWDTETPTSLAEWRKLWSEPGSQIKNEYGDPVTPNEMLEVVTDREQPNRENPSRRWLSENHATLGPNGLARNVVDGRHCVGHGDGTWDLITGEFS